MGGLLNSQEKERLSLIDKFIAGCALYSFQFYLWHSIVLEHVAKVIELDGVFVRYLATMGAGAFITFYIAYLMNAMQQGIGKKIEELKNYAKAADDLDPYV